VATVENFAVTLLPHRIDCNIEEGSITNISKKGNSLGKTVGDSFLENYS
jgi:hypothetical protein